MSNDDRATKVTIERSTTDKKQGLTVAELGEWLQEVHRAGIAPGTRVEVNVGFRSQILDVKARG